MLQERLSDRATRIMVGELAFAHGRPVSYFWVVDTIFHEAALVLAAHGSTTNPDMWLPVRQHVAVLRQQKLFATVKAGYYRQSPDLGAVVRGLRRPRIFVVPFCMGEGHLTQRVIPNLLGWNEPVPSDLPVVKSWREGWLHYTAPVGTHERIGGLILKRIESMLRQYPAPVHPRPGRVSIVLVAHGTDKDPLSRRAVESQALRMERMGLFAAVRCAFLSEQPGVSEVVRASSTPHIVVVPFFLSEGVHVRKDIPAALQKCGGAVFLQNLKEECRWLSTPGRMGRWIWCASALGGDGALTDVILDRVREAVGIHAGARDSSFSLPRSGA
jgi:sirohydrochlorin cobaltochelatase